MSGYLQRMAASAARPSRAVHPLVGGVFAKEQRNALRPEPGVAELLVERPEETLSAAHALPSAEPRQQPMAVEQAEATWQQDASTHAGEQSARAPGEPQAQPSTQARPPIQKPEAPITPRVAFEPLVAGWRQSASPAQGVEESAVKSSAARRVYLEGGEVSAESAQAGEQSSGLQMVLSAPSMRAAEVSAREEAAANREVRLQPVAAMLPAAVARRETTQQQRPQSDAASRGSEEIQIHIGRIEVIAIPQQAQRAAPAKTQRGESLEAYLKRHERRSR